MEYLKAHVAALVKHWSPVEDEEDAERSRQG
jgi:hypothetical protein